MAATSSQEGICSLVETGSQELETKGNTDIQDLILPQVHDVRAKTKNFPSKHYQSKGVPCSDPKMLCQILQKSQQADSSSQSILEENCLSVGLELHGDTPADGNCFFEAVSSQLRRLNCVVQKSSQQLRQEVVAFMRTNRVIQASEGTIHLDSFVYNESFDVYCSRMARDSEWADHVVVVAMARMLQIDIMIVTSSPSSGPEDIIVWVAGQTAFQGDPILLGHVWEFHYVSLQPIGNTDIQDLILPQVHDVRAKTKSVPSKPYQSKGVLCSDPKMLYQILQKSQQADSSSQSKLEENCLSMGLELHGDTPADGNCFFEPVSISNITCQYNYAEGTADSGILPSSHLDGWMPRKIIMLIERYVKTYTDNYASHTPYFDGIVVIEDKLLVIDDDACNLQLYNCYDGKLISTSHRLKFRPYGVCLISKTEVSVCLSDCTIIILPLKSIDDKKLVKTLNVRTRFDRCYSVAKFNSDILIVSGWKYDGMFCWGVVSIRDECLVSTHDICKGDIGRTHLAININTIYISCLTSDSITTGVYAYDIFNPHTQKFLYQHQELEEPGSIMADRDCVYVCGYDRIYQLTDSGQLVTIHTVPSILEGIFYDDQHGLLYTTSYRSNIITVYKMEYLHQPGIPAEILKMDEISIQLFEEALKDGRETVYSIRIMVVGDMGVGKTTLVKRLLGEEVNISERHSTEGIDVHVSCCDVSLLTHEWTRQTKDSDQDYQLQCLVKVLNENYQTKDRVADSEQGGNFKQRERTDIKSMSHNADEGKNTEVIYNRSQEQNFGQNLLSTASQQEESHSSAVATMPGSELGENVATENYKMDQLRNMLKLLQQNINKVKQDLSKHAYLKIFDFAGQYALYSAHQMFLTGRAIYLLVLDASRGVNYTIEDHVQDWMNSIHSYAPPDKEKLNSASSHTSSYKVLPPPVILVGTHIDQIQQGYEQRQCGQRYLRHIRSYLRDKPTIVHLVDEEFAIDNSGPDSRLEELKKKIVKVASQQPYWGEQIPKRWFLLEQNLMRIRDAGVKVISRSTVENLNKEGTVRIEESEELDLFLKYLHETRTIIYFSIEILRENIVLDPMWLIDALKLLINAHPNVPNSQADSGAQSVGPTDNTSDRADTQKWLDFKEKGILALELVDAVWTEENDPELRAHRNHILLTMEQLNIISRLRAFTEIGEKMEDYFFTPCMLRQDTPREIISPQQDPRMVSTPVLEYNFTSKFLPPPIFNMLIAACVGRWPVAKKNGTSEHLIFSGCCIFDLDLFHRLTLHVWNHSVFAIITKFVIDEVKTPDAKLCTRVRKFITLNLSKITSHLGQNLQYELSTQRSPTQAVSEDGSSPSSDIWFVDESHDSDAPLMREHINYARLSVAFITVCGNALRDILLTNFPVQYANIYQVILANKVKLTKGRGRPLLNQYQSRVVFPDPLGQTTGTVDQFDISLLYTLIRNISTVPAPLTGWGIDPLDQPRDSSLGASVERIRFYRNRIIGHSMDGKMSQQDFDDYWNKIDAVLHDIEQALGRQLYRAQLEEQRKQVISVYEAC